MVRYYHTPQRAHVVQQNANHCSLWINTIQAPGLYPRLPSPKSGPDRTESAYSRAAAEEIIANLLDSRFVSTPEIP
ncbi:unnamed protein product, partial [Iphiclides podalirius]